MVTYRAHYSISFESFTPELGFCSRKDPCVCTPKLVYNGWCLSHTWRLKIRRNTPTHNTHLPTASLHPSWFTHQAMTWLCTHQVLLSYLWYGSINNLTKSLSNSRTLIVIETCEAYVLLDTFWGMDITVGILLGKGPMSCHANPWLRDFQACNLTTACHPYYTYYYYWPLLLLLSSPAGTEIFASCCHKILANCCSLLVQL